MHACMYACIHARRILNIAAIATASDGGGGIIVIDWLVFIIGFRVRVPNPGDSIASSEGFRMPRSRD